MTLIPTKRRLGGQMALITGASRGIGLALARELAGEGCDLVLTSREEGNLKQICRVMYPKPIRVVIWPGDVRDAHSVDDLFRMIRSEVHRMDILINNAGIAHENLSVEKLPYPI